MVVGCLQLGEVCLCLQVALALRRAATGCLGHPRGHLRRGLPLGILVSSRLELVHALLQPSKAPRSPVVNSASTA